MKFIRKFLKALFFIGTLIAVVSIIYIWNYKPAPDLSADKGKKEREVFPKGEEFRQGVSDTKKQKADLPPKERLRSHPQGVAIIIDDIGEDLKPVSELLNIDVPLTFAVLPHCTHSEAAAGLIHNAGRDILLHLPMEPYDNPGRNPGRGALFIRMSPEDIRKQLDENIRAVPHICGVNNHMGSLFMENEDKLAIVFEDLKKRGLLFIDSRTTPASKARDLAIQLNIPFAERRAFIDNDNHCPAIFEKIMQAVNEVKTGNGEKIVMIGHPYPDTVQALRKAIPLIEKEGVEIMTLSKLLKSNGDMDIKSTVKRSP